MFIELTSEKLLQLVTGTPRLGHNLSGVKKKKQGKSDGEYSHIREVMIMIMIMIIVLIIVIVM